MNRGGGAEVGPPTADPLDEVYRRVARAHYALAEAGRVDADLHRRSLERLMDVLRFIEHAQGGEEGTTPRP